MISFDPLFDFMHFNKLLMKDLQSDLKLSARTTAKFKKGESVSLATIEKICLYYDIPVEDVVKILPESESQESK